MIYECVVFLSSGESISCSMNQEQVRVFELAMEVGSAERQRFDYIDGHYWIRRMDDVVSFDVNVQREVQLIGYRETGKRDL